MQTDFVPEYLPNWMRQHRRSIDWGVLLAAMFGLIAAWPFLIRSGIPDYTELIHSAFMTSDLSDALREGQIIARWSPHTLNGFGAPIPSFVPQGAPFLAALLEQLITGEPASAVRLVMSAALVAAGVGQYLFCRRLMGAANALFAAGLYVLSPIFGFTIPHVVGDMAGVVGMALLPFALRVSYNEARNHSRGDAAAVILTFAALAYIDPRLAITGAIIAIVLSALNNISSVFRLLFCLLLATALFAPLWLPALTETQFVRWRSTETPEREVLTISALLSPLYASDPAILNTPPQFTVGTFQGIAALSGIVWGVFRRRDRKFILVMAATAATAGIAAVIANESWLTYSMAFSSAVVGGFALEWRMKFPQLARRAFMPVALIFLLFASSGVWLSAIGPTAENFAPLAQIEFEQNGFGTAVLPSGASTPSTLPATSIPERGLIESYKTPPLERIRPGTAARVTPITSGTHASVWQVSLTSQHTILLSLAYFPGWEADIDGKPLPVERDPVTGLIRLTIPAVTNGTLRVSMGTTPERSFAWFVALLGAIAFAVWARFRRSSVYESDALLNVQEARLAAVALALAGIVIIAAAIPGGHFDLRPAPLASLRGSLPITAMSESVQLLAYQLKSNRIRAGEPVSLTLYWSTTAVPETNYGARISLIDLSTMQTVNLTTPAAPGDIPTKRWLADYVVVDSYSAVTPEDLPQGTYQVVVEAFPCSATCDLAAPLRFRDSQSVSRPMIALPAVLTVME